MAHRFIALLQFIRLIFPPTPLSEDLSKTLEQFRKGGGATYKDLVAAGEKAVPGLCDILKDSSLDGTVRFQAANALGDIGSRQALDPLLEALRDSSFNLRRCSALALGKLLDERARKPLQSLAEKDPFVWKDPKTGEDRYLVREDAQRALEMLDGAPLSEPSKLKKESEIFLDDAAKPPPSPLKAPIKILPWPFPGKLKDQNLYNNYEQPTDGYIHGGLDLLQEKGAEVWAVEDGFVSAIETNYPEWKTHFTVLVSLEKGGDLGWGYTHLDPDTYTFKLGDRIRKGQVLGKVVDFFVGKNKGVDHLHLDFARLRKNPGGGFDWDYVADPLQFFDYEDKEAPVIEKKLRFVRYGALEEFPEDASSKMPIISGKVDVLAGISESAYRDHICTWMPALVTLEIQGPKGVKPWRKLVLDQRGPLGDPKASSALYLTKKQKQRWPEGAQPYPIVHFIVLTHTDGDGLPEKADSLQNWDTGEINDEGETRFPNGIYEVIVRAWDLKGNRAERSAKVQIKNESAPKLR